VIKENSGKIYRFKLDHNLGFGFAEIYDFTDYSDFDGRLIYVYNQIDMEVKSDYDLNSINNSGIAMGPIRLQSFPGTRGKFSTKYIGQRKELLINKIPVTKELLGLIIRNMNWNDFDKWYRSDKFEDGESKFVSYDKVRYLERRVLSHISGVATKFTMKKIIEDDNNITDFYDLTQIGNLNLFLHVINTYFPLEKTQQVLGEIKKTNANIGYNK
jgi:hypothetical protein